MDERFETIAFAAIIIVFLVIIGRLEQWDYESEQEFKQSLREAKEKTYKYK